MKGMSLKAIHCQKAGKMHGYNYKKRIQKTRRLHKN